MIQVSDEWKELHAKPLLPETFVEIRSDEVAGVEMAWCTGTNIAYNNTFYVVNNTKPDSEIRWAWLEHNFWVLDGSMAVAPDEQSFADRPCVIGSQDLEMCVTMYLTEARLYDIPGFTITWSRTYDEYATDFKIEVKSGGTIIKSVAVTNNQSLTTWVALPAREGEYYDSVDITVLAWNLPDRRKRIESILFGQTLVFGKKDLLSYSHEQSGDPTSSEVSKNEIQFSLDNSDGRWNPLNPKGEGKNLYEQKKLTVYYGLAMDYKTEWVQAGVFYLSEWSAPSNGLEAKFTARDILGPMLSANCRIDRREVYLGHWLPLFDSVTHAKNFEPISGTDLFVGQVGSVPGPVYTGLLGYDISDLDENADPGYYTSWALLEGVSINDPNTQVIGWGQLTSISVEPDNCTMQKTYELLLEQCSLPEGFTFQCDDEEFDSLCAPLFIDETNLAEYLQLCGGLCGSTVWQNSKGILRFAEPSWNATDYFIPADLSYSYPEVELAKPLKEVRYVGRYQGRSGQKELIYRFADTGESIKVDNPYAFLSQEDFSNYSEIAGVFGNGNIDGNRDSLAKLWRNRTLVTGEFRADPRLELLDVVQVETKYGTISPVMITRIKYSYNGAFHGSYEGKVLYEEEE